MQTTKDYIIIDQLKTDLKNKLNVNNDYDTEVAEVKIGEYLWEDMKVKPSIAIQSETTEIQESLMGNTFIKNVYIIIDLFANNQPGIDEDFIDIYKFKDDVESFIFKSTDWTYQEDSVYIEPSVVYIGGLHDPIKQARIIFFVRYKD